MYHYPRVSLSTPFSLIVTPRQPQLDFRHQVIALSVLELLRTEFVLTCLCLAYFIYSSVYEILSGSINSSSLSQVWWPQDS